MRYTVYSALPDDAKRIRNNVFVDEQGFENEFDDMENSSEHIVLYDGDRAVATARYYPDGDGNYRIGRIAVLREERGKGLGRVLLECAEKEIAAAGASTVTVHAQVRVKGFYQSLGYESQHYYTMDEGVPHVTMVKTIK